MATKRSLHPQASGVQVFSELPTDGQAQVNVLDDEQTNLQEILNPYFKVQEETRKRLQRFNLLNLHNACYDTYRLLLVKYYRNEKDKAELLDDNPILRKG